MNEHHSFHVKTVFIWNVKDPISTRIIFQTMNYLSQIMRCRVSGVGYEKTENNWIVSHLWFLNYETTKTHGKWNRIIWNDVNEKQTAIPFNSHALGTQLVYKSIRANLNNLLVNMLLNVEYQTNHNEFWFQLPLHCSTDNKLWTYYFWPFSVFGVCASAGAISTIHINFGL